jgi:CubicO group peptidase (beta-lactamase class C family)
VPATFITEEKVSAITEWFEGNFNDRGELGAAVSIWERGEEVLSLAAGYCDRDRTRPWTKDTLVPVWSATKGPAAVCALLALHEAGVALARPVADLWPEFAGAGKDAVTIAQLLSHQAGLCALDEKVPIDDYEGVVEALERQAPLWPPGTRHGYHARTFGFLAEELVRRAGGAESLGEYFEDRLREEMELDFWIGLPREEWSRVAVLYPGRMGPGAREQEFLQAFNTPGSLTRRTFVSPTGLNAVADFNQPATWERGFASMGGVGSARGLGKFYAMLAQGGVWQGREIVPELVVRSLSQSLANGPDEVLRTDTAFAAGVMKDPVNAAGEKVRHHFGPSATAFGHPGAGGSLAFADPENGIAFAYVMNQMELGALPGEKSLGLVERLYA